MKVLFIAPNLAAGGAERQWSILLPRLRGQGFDVRVLALDGGGPFVAPLRTSGVPVEVIGMRHQLDPRLARSLLVRRFAPEAIVSRSVNGAYVGLAVSAWRRAPHAYNDHMQVGMRMTPRRELMMRLATRRFDQVIGVAEEQGDAWRARGLPADRFAVVRNGVEEPAVARSRDDVRRELGLDPSVVVALLVATLRPEKRVPDFVSAVRRARETHPELVGLIVGDGIDRGAVEAAIDGDAGVRLLGHRDDVAQLLKAADLFALSSEYEAVPMSILEAMASGLPVLATEVGAIGDVVIEGKTGLLVPPADTAAMAARLESLAADPGLRRLLGEQGHLRQRALWSAEAMVAGYAEILERLGRPR